VLVPGRFELRGGVGTGYKGGLTVEREFLNKGFHPLCLLEFYVKST
jgi:hypothetical protein